MSLEFLLTSFIVILLPGTGNIYTIAVGLGRGFWPSVVAAFGCTLGILPHIVASVVGLAAVLHASALAFEIVRFLGVLYLFYMAVMILREGGALSVEGRRERVGPWRMIRDAVAINLLNPKLTLFFLSFLPQFVPADAVWPTGTFLGLAAAFMAMTFVVFAGYGAAASLARDYVVSRPQVMRWIRGSFAAAFGLLGLRLALADR
jgi:threonine/homoserine/homoserine lactone efflux protein